MGADIFLDDLSKLSRGEFIELWRSGAFTGFTDREMAEAGETDREKMRLMNESLRLISKVKRIQRSRGL